MSRCSLYSPHLYAKSLELLMLKRKSARLFPACFLIVVYVYMRHGGWPIRRDRHVVSLLLIIDWIASGLFGLGDTPSEESRADVFIANILTDPHQILLAPGPHISARLLRARAGWVVAVARRSSFHPFWMVSRQPLGWDFERKRQETHREEISEG